VSAWAFGLLAVSIVIAVCVGDTVFFESVPEPGPRPGDDGLDDVPLIATLLAALLVGEPLSASVLGGSALTLGGLVLIVIARAGTATARRAASGPGVGAADARLGGVGGVGDRAPAAARRDGRHHGPGRPPARSPAPSSGPLPGRAAPSAQIRTSGRSTRWALAVLGLLTAFSSVLFVAGVKYAGVAVATVLSSTAPMFAIPLGMVFLGERMAPAAMVGRW
jgi:drug/metabolite transporter (DMT)-like permease